MITVSPAVLEVIARESWEHMFNGPGKLDPLPGVEPPVRDWAVIAHADPDMLVKHKEAVKALLDADFSVEGAIRLQTRGRQGADDLTSRAKEFRTRLAAFMRDWCRTHEAR